MNELVKWKSSDSSKIDMALARSREHGLARRADTCELLCVCARHDKPFTMHFRRSAYGLFRLVSSVKVEGDASAPMRSAKTSIPLNQFDDAHMTCAWCGSEGINLCECNELVCSGLKKGNRFQCRASCGAVWDGVPLEAVEAMKPVASPSAQAPAPSKNSMRMLESGNPGRFDFLK
jgi:hypothetical protein